MQQYPNISLEKPEHLQKLKRDAAQPYIVYDFYEKLATLAKEKNLVDEEKASFIFNCDVTAFCSDPSQIRGIGARGKTLSRDSGGSECYNTTVLACVSADGVSVPASNDSLPRATNKGGATTNTRLLII